MAQPFTLKLGNVDLSNYIRLAPGEGFDPMDASGFQNPAFSDAPLAEGQLLSNVDAVNREMAWPLHLNAGSKDAVHALVASINTEIATNQQLRVEWKDQGASNSTFYDVAYARFEPDYSYRKAAQNWESGTLRIWCAPPFGHTGTTRVVATGVTPSLPIAIVPLPSLAGDVPALMMYEVVPPFTGTYPRQVNSRSGDDGQQIAAVAVLPHPSYVAYYPAASMVVPSQGAVASGFPTLAGATWAYGSQAILAFAKASSLPAQSSQVVMGAVYFDQTAPMSGRNRVLAVVGAAVMNGTQTLPQAATVCMWATDQQGNTIGPTAVLHRPQTAGATNPMVMRLVDLGIYSMPTYAKKPHITISFGWGQQYATMALNAVVLLPDESLTYLDAGMVDNSLTTQGPYQRTASVMFDGTGADDAAYVNLQGFYATNTVFQAEGYSADGLRRGAIPKVQPSPTAAIAILGHLQQSVGNISDPYDRIGTPTIFKVSARERFQFAR